MPTHEAQGLIPSDVNASASALRNHPVQHLLLAGVELVGNPPSAMPISQDKASDTSAALPNDDPDQSSRASGSPRPHISPLETAPVEQEQVGDTMEMFSTSVQDTEVSLNP